MEKLKKALLYIWLLGGLAVLYGEEMWSYIYLRHNGSEHPKENAIMGLSLLIFVIPLIIILIYSSIKNRDKPVEKVKFTWSGMALSFLVVGGHDFIQSRAMKIVNSTVGNPAISADNATKDIISLYLVYFATLTVLCTVAEFAEKNFKSRQTSFAESEIETERQVYANETYQ